MAVPKRRSLPSLVCIIADEISCCFVRQSNGMPIIVPGILSQLGPDSLASLRKLAEAYQQAQAQGGAGAEEDDEIPELVENFDKAEVSEVSETAEEKAE